MKLVIQIPCHNEESTLPDVLKSLPTSINGISKIEIQIIDDSSSDRTVEVAKEFGVKHFVQIPGRNRKWLGRAFRLGVDEALRRGADIIVNTDGDNQYPGDRIKDLVQPILERKADLVIGNRKPEKVKEFSLLKRFFQKLGNLVFSLTVGETVPDAVSGFRAYSRRAALKINIITNFTYTVDSLVQAYKKGLDVKWIEISPNKKTRESRLIDSVVSKVRKSGITIVRIATVYEPFKAFFILSTLPFVAGSVLLLRFLYFYFFVPAEAAGHIQSVVFGGVFIIIAIQLLILGIIGDLLAANRTFIEDALTRIKALQLSIDKETE